MRKKLIVVIITICLVSACTNEEELENSDNHEINTTTSGIPEIISPTIDADDSNINNIEPLEETEILDENRDTMIFASPPIGAYIDKHYVSFDELTESEMSSLINKPYYIYTESGDTGQSVMITEIEKNVFLYEATKTIDANHFIGISLNKQNVEEKVSTNTYFLDDFQIVRNKLDEYGLVNTPVVFRRVYEFDVMGDDKKERILVASNYDSYDYFRDSDEFFTFEELEKIDYDPINEYEGVGLYYMLLIVNGDDVLFLDSKYRKLDSIYFDDTEGIDTLYTDEFDYHIDDYYNRGYFFTENNRIDIIKFHQINACESGRREGYLYPGLFPEGVEIIRGFIPIDEDEKYEIITYRGVNFFSLCYLLYSWDGERFSEEFEEYVMKTSEYDLNYMDAFDEKYITW